MRFSPSRSWTNRCRSTAAPMIATRCWPVPDRAAHAGVRRDRGARGSRGRAVYHQRFAGIDAGTGLALAGQQIPEAPGPGPEALAPAELITYVDRESREFYERARLDKQNLVRSLHWTGQSLYDVADARLRACAADGASPSLDKLFSETIDCRRLQDAFSTLRVPRHLFKFMYRVLTANCNASTRSTAGMADQRGDFSVPASRCTSASRTPSIAASGPCEKQRGRRGERERGRLARNRSFVRLPFSPSPSLFFAVTAMGWGG